MKRFSFSREALETISTLAAEDEPHKGSPATRRHEKPKKGRRTSSTIWWNGVLLVAGILWVCFALHVVITLRVNRNREPFTHMTKAIVTGATPTDTKPFFRITYSYSVDGQEFTGEKDILGSLDNVSSHDNGNLTTTHTLTFRAKSSFTVYYDPLNPSRHCDWADVGWSDEFMHSAGIDVILAVIATLLTAIRAAYKK